MTNHDARPDPGWWQCDSCNADVRPMDAQTTEKVTREGTTTLAFCPGCWNDE